MQRKEGKNGPLLKSLSLSSMHTDRQAALDTYTTEYDFTSTAVLLSDPTTSSLLDHLVLRANIFLFTD